MRNNADIADEILRNAAMAEGIERLNLLNSAANYILSVPDGNIKEGLRERHQELYEPFLGLDDY